MTQPVDPPGPPASPPPSVPPPGAAGEPPSPGAGGGGGHGRSAPAAPAPALDGRERQLDAQVVKVWRTFTAIGVAVPLLPAAVFAAVLVTRDGATGATWTLVTVLPLGVAAATLWTVWYPRARYQRWRWRLTDLALELRHGVILHRLEVVPYFRIQQIDVTQGPLDRLLDLSSLQVTTAAASGSVELPGIAAADAPAVRADLLARAAAAVAEHPDEVRDAV